MSLKERVYSVLIVSAAEGFNDALSALLPEPNTYRHILYQTLTPQNELWLNEHLILYLLTLRSQMMLVPVLQSTPAPIRKLSYSLWCVQNYTMKCMTKLQNMEFLYYPSLHQSQLSQQLSVGCQVQESVFVFRKQKHIRWKTKWQKSKL